MTNRFWTLDDINTISADIFVERLGFLFEQSPWIVASVAGDRPFASCRAVHTALLNVVKTMDADQQEALIRAHPDLVGRAALAGTLTRESTSEQQAAGLDPGRLTPDEIDRFQTLNADYLERFGFPFVICARENTKESILAAFETRVAHDRATEIATALTEIGKICWYRLISVVTCES